MHRGDTIRGLKIGWAILGALALLAVAVYEFIEYTTPIPSSSRYNEFLMSAEPTNSFSSVFGQLSDALEAGGFEVRPYAIATNNVRFEFALESAGGLDRLQCISVRRDSLTGFVVHWTEPLLENLSDPENAWRSATISHDLFGVETRGMHHRDLVAFDKILEDVLETYRNKSAAYLE